MPHDVTAALARGARTGNTLVRRGCAASLQVAYVRLSVLYHEELERIRP